MIEKEDGKYEVESKNGMRTFGKYDTRKEAVKRLREMEEFKRQKQTSPKGTLDSEKSKKA